MASVINLDEQEQQWVRQAQRGDREAFSNLVRRYHWSVRACLAVRLDDPHEAEDLAQEVFITAFAKFAQFDPDRPVGPWLRSIAFYLLRNHQRKFRPQAIGGSEELAALLDQSVAAGFDADREGPLVTALLDCLERLDGPARELLHLRYGQELEVRELAARLQRGYSALTMQLHRLREVLARCVGEKTLTQAEP